MIEVDLLVVGAGPAGLYAAYYAGFRELRTAVIDALPEPGGQVAALYPEKQIYDIAGFPAVRGRDLVAALVDQAQRFTPNWLLDQSAQELTRLPDGRLRIVTTSGTMLITRSIVIAGGIGTFTPAPAAGRRRLPRTRDRLLRRRPGRLRRTPRARGRRRRQRPGLGPDPRTDRQVGHAHPPQAEVHRPREFVDRDYTLHRDRPHALCPARRGRATDLERVVVRDTGSDELVELDCTRIVAALGFTANLGPLTGWGLRIVDRHIVVDSRMFTGVEGIYAAGDITDYPGKVRLISVGFGEAALAVNNAAVAASPEQSLFPGHSSETAA